MNSWYGFIAAIVVSTVAGILYNFAIKDFLLFTAIFYIIFREEFE